MNVSKFQNNTTVLGRNWKQTDDWNHHIIKDKTGYMAIYKTLLYSTVDDKILSL